nr:receptor-type guanylate cyclase gcy-4-like isoform X2 [Procambarus clarkii]
MTQCVAGTNRHRTSSSRIKMASLEEEGETQSSASGSSLEEITLVSVKVGWFYFNPVSRKGRALHLLQMLVLPFIPIVALITQNCIAMSDALRNQAAVSSVTVQVQHAVDIGLLLRALQLERTELCYYVLSNASSTLRMNITNVYERTNDVIEGVQRWPNIQRNRKRSRMFQSRVRFQIRLQDFRDSIDPLETHVTKVVSWYNEANFILLSVLVSTINTADASNIWQTLVAYQNVMQCEEQFGISLVYGAAYYLRGWLDSKSYLTWVESTALAGYWLNQTLALSPSIHHRLRKKGFLTELAKRITERDDIIGNKKRNGSVEAADVFMQESTAFKNSIRGVEASLIDDIRDAINGELEVADGQYTLALVVLLLVLLISPVIIVLVRKATSLIHVYAFDLLLRSAEVKKEKRKSDNLLYQLLPRTVAHYLKQSKQVPAEYFESVTIYLSDIVGFTRISSESSPLQVVTLLNTLYKQFDSSIEKYDVYKMETIGDAYMVVSGLPNRNGERHAPEIAEMAITLLEMVSHFELIHKKGEMLRVRIGIHSGTCVAGVVGTKMPRYCMFGKTMTTAHFMESSGEPMKIHVSETTHKLLMATGRYVLKFHRRLQVVSKYRASTGEEAELDTFWLLGRTNPQETRQVDLTSEYHTPAFLAYVTDRGARHQRHTASSRF